MLRAGGKFLLAEPGASPTAPWAVGAPEGHLHAVPRPLRPLRPLWDEHR